MDLNDHIALGALAISGAIFAVLNVLWPGFVGPWFWILVITANAHALLGVGWDEHDDLLYRLASTNSLLLLPLFFPVAWVLAFVFAREEGDEDE